MGVGGKCSSTGWLCSAGGGIASKTDAGAHKRRGEGGEQARYMGNVCMRRSMLVVDVCVKRG